MSKGGGGSTSTIDPRVYTLLSQNVSRASNIANKPFEAYGGQLTADMNPTQNYAGNLLNSGAMNAGSGAINSGINAASNAAGFSAPQASAATASPGLLANPAAINRGSIQNVSGGDLTGGIAKYQSPYTDSVVNATLGDIDRQRQMALNQGGAAATQANAFGGSRHGVADAQTNEAYGRIGAQTAAQLRDSGFSQAAGLAQSDASRVLQAAGANQGIDLSVAGQNAGFGQQAGLFNAGNQQAANLFNAGGQNQIGLANQNAALAGQGINLQGAGLLGNLGNDQFQNFLSGTNAINQFGTQQQMNQQAGLDSAYQQYLRQFGYPAEMQQLLNQSLGLLPAQSQQQKADNTGGILGGLGALGSGAAALLPLLSDANAKTDIRTLRYDRKGRRWVAFRYLWDEPGTIRHGVIAQEVERTDPHAVIDGLIAKLVDYSKLEAA